MNEKSWRFRNETGQTGVAELFVYGDIEDYKWLDEDVTAQEFAKDLEALGSVSEIVVRINSGGGSVFAATAIATLLKSNPAMIKVKIDGIAASAATIIAMAGDEISIPTNAMMMIHDPLMRLFGAYNEMKLEGVVKTLQDVKRALVEGYRSRTGLDEEEIAQIMRDETWLTGREAVEKGFADVLIEDQVAASLEGQTLVIAGESHDMSKYAKFPKEQFENAQKPVATGIVASAPKGETQKKPKEVHNVTIEQIRNEHPELYEQIRNEGVTAERKRFEAFKVLENKGHAELIDKAKYETGVTAEACALEMMKADSQLGEKHIQNLTDDAKVLAGVGNDPTPQDDKSQAEAMAKVMASGAQR